MPKGVKNTDINNQVLTAECFEIRNLYIDTLENQKNTEYILQNVMNHDDYVLAYAYILHDQDYYDKDTYNDEYELIGHAMERKKEHYHCYVKLKKRLTFDQIRNWIGIPITQIQRFEPKHFNNKLLYLTHICHPEKHQYNITSVVSNKHEYLEHLVNEYKKNEKIDLLTYTMQLLSSRQSSFKTETIIAELIKLYTNKEIRQNYIIIRDLVKEHNEYVRDNAISTGDRDIEKARIHNLNENRIITRLCNTFDRVSVTDDDGQPFEIMRINKKEKKQR